MRKIVPGILIAAPKSGSGKTLITCGLLELWRRRGLRPLACKCGPDYIDPMFHRYVLGTPGMNLDLFFLDADRAEQQLTERMSREQADLAVVEGVMGYYDGIGGTSLRASAWEVADSFSLPVLLVLDGKGASLSLAAEAAGFLSFQTDSRIRGLLLNRVSGMMYQRLRPVLEQKTGLPVLGYLPECPECRIESRHLGLFLPGEIERLREKIGALADQMEKTFDLDALERLAGIGTFLPEYSKSESPFSLRIGVARDEAFCFYYQENLELLKKMGAELIEFSPLRDAALPQHLDGLLLGGGYPENYARQLSENRSMLASIHAAVAAGLPFLAECGGFLYLHRELEGSDGRFYPMTGVYDFRAFRTDRLQRFGYVFLTAPSGATIRGHEFHYWESEDPGEEWLAVKPEVDKDGAVVPGKRSWRCMHGTRSQMAGFPHLYYPSAPGFLSGWLAECRRWKQKMTEE